MSSVRYLPGEGWLSVVRSGVVVLMPASTTPDVLDRLWHQLGESPNLQAVLPIVAGGFGQDLGSMPPFGLVSYTDRLHVLLRGPVHLRITDAQGATTAQLSGEHVTTWTERIIDDGGDRFILSTGAEAASPESFGLEASRLEASGLVASGLDEASAFPLEAGIVRASGVSVGLTDWAVPAAAEAAAAEPATAPVNFPVSKSTGTSVSEPVNTAVSEPASTAVSEPAGSPVSEPASTPVPEPGETADDDPERAITGAVEAEEFATINPNLYLTSTDSVDEDGQRIGDGADSVGDDQNQESEPDPDLQTTGYDHLWDQTVLRRVEDAAVRPPEEDSSSDDDERAGSDAEEEQRASAQSTTSGTDVSDDAAVPPSSASSSNPAPEPIRGRTPEPTPIPLPAPGQLIDSVPWARKSSGTDEPPAVSVSQPPPTAAMPPAAAAPPAARSTSLPATQTASQNQLDSDDHDGQTVMRSDLQNQPAQNQPAQNQPAQTQPVSEPRPATGPLVLARLCPQGHANPPEAPDCGECSQPLDGEPREVPRPSLGTMRISSGEVVELDQALIIGRQPSVSRVQGRGMPKLVQVTSTGGDISRSHVEVRLDGWHVQLCDLKATNGTVLLRPGQPPRRLGEGETAFLLDGDVAQLGDDVFLRFEGLR